jgi:hypothetical protein
MLPPSSEFDTESGGTMLLGNNGIHLKVCTCHNSENHSLIDKIRFGKTENCNSFISFRMFYVYSRNEILLT